LKNRKTGRSYLEPETWMSKVERIHEDLRQLSIQESREPTPDREEVFPLNPSKDHQQCEVTIPREY
jgi:hypothetical protein